MRDQARVEIYCTAPRQAGWWYSVQPVDRGLLNTVRNPLDLLLHEACVAQIMLLEMAERSGEPVPDPKDLQWMWMVPVY